MDLSWIITDSCVHRYEPESKHQRSVEEHADSKTKEVA